MRTSLAHIRPQLSALLTCMLVAGTLLQFNMHTAGASNVAQVSTPAGVDWGASANALRGHNNARVTFVCPSGGHSTRLWGTDIYTDDSSVCAAAVHTGKMSEAQGGIVTVEIRAGLASYAGSARNGITSNSYGLWPGSFAVVGVARGGGVSGAAMGGGSWSENPTAYLANIGARYVYLCPSGGTQGRVWGTGTYTSDSSVCTAAVHAGQITFAMGGIVTIRISPGLKSYVGSTKNGVVTRSYGPWPGSFKFIGSISTPTPVPTTDTGGTTWTANATAFRGKIGHVYRYSCPVGGSLGTVWGTQTYTDDSSVCTAAVHAGRISVAQGGSVRIRILSGRESYQGTTSNGVTTRGYGSWWGSFEFV
jgi:hypothetical protein